MSGYLRYPALSSGYIAFVCEDALWIAARPGGLARRLTAAPQRVHSPCFSPDGQEIVFNSNAEGGDDVYAVSIHGGIPRRLSFMGPGTQVVGFDPDGNVLFESSARGPLRSSRQIYRVPLLGGEPQPLPVGRCRTVSFDTDGDRVAIGLNQIDTAYWKRYRGGTAGAVWVGTLSTAHFEKLNLEIEGNHVLPTFVGGRVFFISDPSGWANIWSCLPDGSDLKEHTHFTDFYVRHMRAHGAEIVFQKGAELWILDTRTGESRALEIETRPAGAQSVRRFVDPEDHLQEVSLSPDAKRLVSIVRGKALEMKSWTGPTRWLGPRSGARLRAPAWLESSQELTLITDEGSECESLALYSVEDGSCGAKVSLDEVPRIQEVAASPCDRLVAMVDISGRVSIVDFDAKEIARETVFEATHAYKVQDLTFCPEGRWLAFVVRDEWTIPGGILYLYDTDASTLHTIGGEDLPIHSPTFDPDGRFLYVLSDRTFNPVLNGVTFGASVPRATRVYAFVLSATGLSPFDPQWIDALEEEDDADEDAETDEGATETKEAETASEAEAGQGDAEPQVEVEATPIDLDGIGRRLAVCPDIPVGDYSCLRAAPDHKLLFLDWPLQELNSEASPGRPATSELVCLNIKTGEQIAIMKNVESFEVRGEKTLVRTDTGLHILKTGEPPPKNPTRPGPGRLSGEVDLYRMSIEIDPQAEWRQMFLEAWRLQRDRFWTPTMAGIDWPSVRDHYLPLLSKVHTRAELSDLIWELHGELGTSHAYEFGGDYPYQHHYDTGRLGADMVWDGEAYRVERILEGDCWDPGCVSAMAVAGVNVKEDDQLLSIDGLALTEAFGPDQALVNRAGQEVELRVRTPGQDSRAVSVKTLSTERPLRYRDWVARNRRKVLERSAGRLGYIHIPDMAGRGLSEFYRAWRVQSKAPGLVLDVRDNGGGFVSQIILDALRRKVIGHGGSRHGFDETYPSDAVRGPIVAVCDQFAGSDGDIFSHSFKEYGLGPLVGHRTWGGTIGIDPNSVLADGTVVTQPEFATLFTGVGWALENHGVDPDIEVDLDPASAAAGLDPQLDKAIEVALEMLEAAPLTTPVPPEIPSRKF